MTKKRRKPRGPRPAGTTTAERPAAPATSRRPGAEAPPTRPASGSSRARAEKKELARQAREHARKKIARQALMRRLAWALGIGVLVAAGVLLFTRDRSAEGPAGPLPGELATEAPWPANAAQAQERAEAIGLPPEGTALHIHSNLQVFVHGEAEPVPADVGVDASSDPAYVAAVHTHEGSGTIHIESSFSQTFTLGQFFDVWGVRLTGTCMGGYCEDATNALQVFVDGQEVAGSPVDVELADQQAVVITYGTPDELPDPIPATFDFSSVPQ